MIWDNTDKETYQRASSLNVGQININSKFGLYIYNISKDEKYNTYLEIGTWNGLGSTRCFIEGFLQRNKSFKFYSLECNKEKCIDAYNMYKNIENVKILNQTILDEEDYKDISKVFPNMIKHWHDIDVNNIKLCKNFFKENNEKFFDVVLLDGGEYTTYFEYKKIKDKSKVIMLDDTNSDKCSLIVSELKNDLQWELILEDNEKTGFAIFRKN